MDQKALDNLYRTQSRLFKNKSVLELLLEVEGIFEQLGLYVYDNWIEGKIIDGPVISRHWIEFTLMYDHDEMPDPDGALRLTQYDIQIEFAKDQYPVIKKIISPDDLATSNADPENPSSGKRRAKIDYKPVWLVRCKFPRSFVDDFYSDYAFVDGDEIDIEDTEEAEDFDLDTVYEKN